MKLTFCGAAQTTTGSQHLLEVNGLRILLDCGLYQGRRAESYERNKTFLFDPASVDCVILSHAHIDHSGNLPNLCKSGFVGNIYTTFATRDLCQVMLEDSAKIQVSDVAWLNRHREREGLPPVTTLYTPLEAEQSLRQFITLGYGRPLPIGRGVTLTFLDAGHILGSAQVVLDIEETGSSRPKRLVFSGDLGRGANPILRDPVPPQDVDFLLMESTYGDREHELETDAKSKLAEIVTAAVARRGKVIIPAFAVERTQQLIYALHRLREENAVPEIPIFVDSPLAVSATEIFRLHRECFNEAIYNFLFSKRDPFGFEGLELIRSVDQSKELNDLNQPAIIISASGMCESGRILHHLKNNLDNPDNTILFVGYCAPDTLGRRLRDGAETVSIFGRKYRRRARVESIDSYSGHADRSELIAHFRAMTGSLERVWMVHGEPDQCLSLAKALRSEGRAGQIEVPEWKTTAEF